MIKWKTARVALVLGALASYALRRQAPESSGAEPHRCPPSRALPPISDR